MSHAHERFDASGALVDEAIRSRLAAIVHDLVVQVEARRTQQVA